VTYVLCRLSISDRFMGDLLLRNENSITPDSNSPVCSPLNDLNRRIEQATALYTFHVQESIEAKLASCMTEIKGTTPSKKAAGQSVNCMVLRTLPGERYHSPSIPPTWIMCSTRQIPMKSGWILLLTSPATAHPVPIVARR